MSISILHIIDSLAFGGAERMLHGLVNAMPQHQHVVVYLHPQYDFEENAFHAEVICLDYQGKGSMLRMRKQLKHIIQKYDIELIHSHLMLSTLLARWVCPRNIPLVSSYHSLVHHPQSPQFSRLWLFVDRLSCRKRFHQVFVSQTVKDCITSQVSKMSNFHVLPNFVADVFYEEREKIVKQHAPMRILVVGSFRPERNHQIVIDLLKMWPKLAIEVDFFGKGPLEASLQAQALGIKQIRFCGFQDEVAPLFTNYDLLLAPSRFEGFGLAVAEAMAGGLPVLAADIPAFREICGAHALFFHPLEVDSLKRQIDLVVSGKIDLEKKAESAKEWAMHFQKSIYLNKLEQLYQQIMRISSSRPRQRRHSGKI